MCPDKFTFTVTAGYPAIDREIQSIVLTRSGHLVTVRWVYKSCSLFSSFITSIVFTFLLQLNSISQHLSIANQESNDIAPKLKDLSIDHPFMRSRMKP